MIFEALNFHLKIWVKKYHKTGTFNSKTKNNIISDVIKY